MLNSTEILWQEERLEQVCQWQAQRSYGEFLDDESLQACLVPHRRADRVQAEDMLRKACENAAMGDMLSPDDVAVRARPEWLTMFAELWDYVERDIGRKLDVSRQINEEHL